MTAYRKMETFPISTSAIDGIAFLSIKDTNSIYSVLSSIKISTRIGSRNYSNSNCININNVISFLLRFLLDFKREFSYPHVYRVWETIWAAGHVASPQFGLFIALSLVETYRDIIIDR